MYRWPLKANTQLLSLECANCRGAERLESGLLVDTIQEPEEPATFPVGCVHFPVASGQNNVVK